MGLIVYVRRDDGNVLPRKAGIDGDGFAQAVFRECGDLELLEIGFAGRRAYEIIGAVGLIECLGENELPGPLLQRPRAGLGGGGQCKQPGAEKA